MSHLWVGTPSNTPDSTDGYDLKDLAIPLHLGKNEMLFFLSSTAHGGGAANQDINLPFGNIPSSFSSLAEKKPNGIAKCIYLESISDLSLHFDFHDAAFHDLHGLYKASLDTEGIKQSHINFIKEGDATRPAKVRRILEKASSNQKCLADFMEWKKPRSRWHDSSYRMIGKKPAFLHYMKQEISLMSGPLDRMTSSDIRTIMSRPTISESINKGMRRGSRRLNC